MLLSRPLLKAAEKTGSLSLWQWLWPCVLPDAFCPCYPGSGPLATVLAGVVSGTVVWDRHELWVCAEEQRTEATLDAKVVFHTSWPLVLDVTTLHSNAFSPSPCCWQQERLLHDTAVTVGNPSCSLFPSYLSEEDVLDQTNPFVQLVSGVVWLLRDGEVYINESRDAECGNTQTTGTFDKFINVISARTAVGHDRQGRLVLVHVDGQTESRGVNLWEMAEFLKQQGVINAINLDGGGSATLVLNGTLANYPSEHCSFDSTWRCPRRVSTVLCVHEPRCDPPGCSGHGLCQAGHCRCSGAFWTGPACDSLDCGPANCSLHGLCTPSGCLCDAGWTGSNCTEACAPGFYGESCSQKCQCQHGGSCDPVHGACSCPPGFYGTSCEHECPMGWFGPNCQSQCVCEHSCPCDPQTGSCNTTHDGALQEELLRAGQCVASQNKERRKERFSLSESTWLSLSCGLALLLVLSALGNVGLVLRARSERQHGDYRYHPLRDINGEATHTPSAAAWEPEDTREPEDTQDSL
ncbi:N-acetylglucosamine-1-phosphodiester alpha-N-acetylglucosaminidase [Corapipo altera]|uniref:N-acetylglucosamine-1-phosphodiester alpha-N-acetylglucosaminidase n=1 Tax=Corapipo altera TaxID=415028 RepID=UPI000FD655DD|nr:N-acetylglucosamine-1-phosphodiester alpha-N-acetylglucosaminidase [Corapipo altera]